MYFRNLTLFRFASDVSDDLARLEAALAEHRLRPCGDLERATHGFVPPVHRDDDAPLTHAVNGSSLFTVAGEEKMLPAAVVNRELQERIKKIATEEGRRVGGRERKRIKESLLDELLPRAFVRSSRMSGYVDTRDGWLVLDTASRKAAEDALTQLREALGSFPAVPLTPEEGPRVLMTHWLSNGNLPAGFSLGDECELRDSSSANGAIWRGRREQLDGSDVQEHLRNGKQVYRLGLIFDDRLSFVLGDDLIVRKLQFLDVVSESLAGDETDPVTIADAEFALLSLELGRLLAKLAEVFSIARPAAPDMRRLAA